MAENQNNAFTRRMFIKGVATSFGALPVFVWPRWAQAFYYNLGFFKKGADPVTYIEDVFSTYIYTGNGGTQTITNGIDLAANGGLVWMKSRNNTYIHELYDTARGVNMHMHTDETGPSVSTAPNGVTSFNSNGFTTGNYLYHNGSGVTFASWTFRKATKFFETVTYSGDGVNSRQITHTLGIAPGMVIVKRTDAAGDWMVYHRSRSAGDKMLVLNTTDAETTYANASINDATATYFRVDGSSNLNATGGSYIAYLFAHDTSANGLIQCGTFTTDGAAKASVNLGWEAQYVMMKRSDGVGNWIILDQTRGWGLNKYASLIPNTSGAETNSNGGEDLTPTPTGFKVAAITSANAPYVYIAIRRPMKVPTTGTQVLDIYSDTASNTTHTVNFNIAADAILQLSRSGSAGSAVHSLNTRMTSISLATYASFSEGSFGTLTFNYGISANNSVGLVNPGGNSTSAMNYAFKRAPGFFDQVCYTGNQQTGAITVSHNLGTAPELIIIKKRNNTGDWIVKHKDFGDHLKFIRFNTTSGVNAGSTSYWNNTAPTVTTFTVGTDGDINGGGAEDTFVAYLFASCSGVSKIGSFMGSASDVTVGCGFSGQPRFVLVKRTDSAGDWIVVDATRGTSVYSTPNASNPETSATVITFTTGGFVAKAGTVANAASGATYIFMAIA